MAPYFLSSASYAVPINDPKNPSPKFFPHHATPGGITLKVQVAKKKISLQQNVEQEITSTVLDEFGKPVPNVKLAIIVTTPSGSQSYDRTTDPDGTDHLKVPLSETGAYKADVTAKNPNAGGSDQQGSTKWRVTQ